LKAKSGKQQGTYLSGTCPSLLSVEQKSVGLFFGFSFYWILFFFLCVGVGAEMLHTTLWGLDLVAFCV
jgi:hypothetical protein